MKSLKDYLFYDRPIKNIEHKIINDNIDNDEKDQNIDQSNNNPNKFIVKKLSNRPDLVFDNTIFHNKNDFDGLTIMHLLINNITLYKSMHRDNVDSRTIEMSNIIRRVFNLRPENQIDRNEMQIYNENLTESKYLKIKIYSTSESHDIISVHEDAIKDFIKYKFKDHLFFEKQKLIIEYENNNLIIEVMKGRGFINNDSEIDLSSNDSNLNIIGAKLLKRDLFMPNYNFENIGIGGLDNNLIEIFKSALCTRAFSSSTIDKLGIRHVKGILLYGPPGTGKCHAKNTPILMYNGEIKMVQDIIIGDQIMGDDSKPRTVYNLAKGREIMYKIITNEEDSFIANESHILSLRYCESEIIDISIKDYLNLPKHLQSQLKIFKVGVEFTEKFIDYDPYELGYFLGNSNLELNKVNNNILTKYNLLNNKHIPYEYKCNSKINRLKLLQGILDGGGYHNDYFELFEQNKVLANDIVYLVRSLGFHASEPNNDIIHIHGENLSQISLLINRTKEQQNKNVLLYDFTLNKLEEDDYYGFVIDGNHRYLLGNFIVTHNTLIARKIGSMISNIEPKVVSGPELLNKYVGQSEENIRNLFREAIEDHNNENLHVIIFDEIDAICKRRGRDGTGANVNDNIVNQLLSLIDGVHALNNIFIIAMTNRKELLDPALLRAGRIELCLHINLPDYEGRKQIFRIHTDKMSKSNMIKDIDYDYLAKNSENYSGAEIESVVKRASTNALHQLLASDKKNIVDIDINITMEHFIDALESIEPIYGRNNKKIERMIPENYESNFTEKYNTVLSEISNCFNKQYNFKKYLIKGNSRSGKTTLVADLALKGQIKLTKLVRAIDMISMDEIGKINYIGDIILESYNSSDSLVIIDDVEILINFVQLIDSVSYSNRLYQVLLTILKTFPENKNNRLTLIITCGNYNLSANIGQYFDKIYFLDY